MASNEISFTFDGKRYNASETDTIATALYRSNVKVITRSIKFHRPRGLYCGMEDCPNCLANVNGIPNVRTCTTQVKNGMIVKSQNRILSRDLDPISIMDHLYRNGFNYHHKFIRPAFMNGTYQRIIRRMAGIGKLPETDQAARPSKETSADVLIIGGESSALIVAKNCASLGLSVHMIQHNSAWMSPIEESLFEKYGGIDPRLERRSNDTIGSASRDFRWLSDSVAIGAFDDGTVGAMTNDQLHIIRPKTTVLAEGLREAPIRFENWDLPGVLQESAARRLLKENVSPGNMALLIGDPDRCLNLSIKLQKIGCTIASIIVAPNIGIEFDSLKMDKLRTGWKLLGAKGRLSVKKAIIADERERSESVSCDTIISCGRLLPKMDLARQLGCEIILDENKNLRIKTDIKYETSQAGIFAIGGCAGIESPSKSWQSAEVASAAIEERFRKVRS